MTNKPINKEYLINSLKSFKKDVLDNRYQKKGAVSGSAIESISVNGTPIEIDENKNVDIPVPSVDDINMSNYLSKTNMDEYVPTEDYHPATKKYVDEHSGSSNTPGKSAYEIAVENGFAGTEAEWIESLKGEDGRSITSIVKDSDNNIIVTYSDGLTENVGQLSADVHADFLTSDGFGNIRYYSDKLQYYNSTTSTWSNIETNESESLSFTLTSTGWSDNEYTLTIENIGNYNGVDITCPYDTMSDEQLESMMDANIMPKTITATTLTLKAYGNVPTMDLPIIVILRGDL